MDFDALLLTLAAKKRRSNRRADNAESRYADPNDPQAKIRSLGCETDTSAGSEITNKRKAHLTETEPQSIDEQLAELIVKENLSESAPGIIQRGIKTVADLSRRIYYHKYILGNSENCPLHEVYVKLENKLETLGCLAYHGFDTSENWVSALTRKYPTLNRIQKMSPEQLKFQFGRYGMPNIATEKLFMINTDNKQRKWLPQWREEVTISFNSINDVRLCLDYSMSLERSQVSSVKMLLSSLRHRQQVFTVGTKGSESEHPYITLLKILHNCDLSAKMTLFRELFDQRYSVPLIVPGSDEGQFSIYSEALRFVKIKLAKGFLEPLKKGTIPRVAFISRREVEVSENAQIVNTVLNCNIASASCKNDIGTVAELGVGFLQDQASIHPSSCMVLYVSGKYQHLEGFIEEFADIIVDELNPGEYNNLLLNANVSSSGTPQLIRWESSPSVLKYEYDDALSYINGSFNDVAEQMKKILVMNLNSMHLNEKLFLPNHPPNNISIPPTDNLTDYLEQRSFILEKMDFKDMRENFALQKSFAKETKLNLALKSIRSDQVMFNSLQASIHNEVNDRIEQASKQSRLPVLREFQDLLKESDRCKRVAGMYQLETYIANQCDLTLETEQNAVREAHDHYMKDKNDSDALAEYNIAKRNYHDKGVSLDHLWREISHIYCANRTMYCNIPQLAAQHLTDGFPLEILDGDAGAVNLAWFKRVMLSLTEQLSAELNRKPKCLVVSAMGTQSTGKSTLLNTMFGCRLRTSAGQCTRGVHLQLVKADGRSYDFVLVLDTEGIRSPEYSKTDKGIWRDNQMATLAVLAADVCFVTAVNEEDSAIKEVLPIVMLAYKRAAIAEATSGPLRTLLSFVYSRVDTTQIDKFERNKQQLTIELREAEKTWHGSHCKRGEHSSEQCTDNEDEHIPNLIADIRTGRSEDESDVKYIGLLKQGEKPPSDTPNYEYGDNVVQIRKYVQKRLDEKGVFSGHDLLDWVDYLELVLKCFEATDFELHFQTNLQYNAYNKLTDKINQARYTLSKAYTAKFDEYETIVQSADTEPDINDLLSEFKEAVKSNVQKQSEIIKNILENPANDRFKKFEQKQWDHFVGDQATTWTRQLKTVFDNRWNVSVQQEKYEHDIVIQLREAKSRNPAILENEKERHEIFTSIFENHKQRAKHDYPSIDVRKKIQASYNYPASRINPLKAEQYLWIDGDKPFLEGFSALMENVFKEKAQEITKYAKPLGARVRALFTNVNKYDESIVQEANNITHDFVRSHHLKAETEKRLHTMVYALLENRLGYRQKNWELNNNLAVRLETSKERLLTKFQNICKGFVGVNAIAQDLVGGLKQAINSGFEMYLARKLKDKVSSQKWMHSPQAMQAHLDLHLLELIKQKKTKELLMAVSGSKNHYKEVLSLLIVKSAQYHEAWREMMLDIKNAIASATSSVDQAKMTPLIFKQNIIHKLPKTLRECLAESIWKDIFSQSADGVNWPEVSHLVVEDLDALANNPIEISNTRLAGLVEKLLVRESLTLAGERCSETCPTCGMLCTKLAGHEGHLANEAKKHDCPHQPQGLVGKCWIDNLKHRHQLIAESCTEMVANNCYFMVDNEVVWYKNFCKKYKTWALPKIKDRQEIREFIFYKYQKDLVKKYSKPFPRNPCIYIPPEYKHDPTMLENKLKAKAAILFRMD